MRVPNSFLHILLDCEEILAHRLEATQPEPLESKPWGTLKSYCRKKIYERAGYQCILHDRPPLPHRHPSSIRDVPEFLGQFPSKKSMTSVEQSHQKNAPNTQSILCTTAEGV